MLSSMGCLAAFFELFFKFDHLPCSYVGVLSLGRLVGFYLVRATASLGMRDLLPQPYLTQCQLWQGSSLGVRIVVS